jgi:hypothetical protein
MSLKEYHLMRCIRKMVLVSLICSGFLSVVAAQDYKIPESKSGKYLYIVKRSLDSLLANAVDRYGKEHSGLIISILNCRDASPTTPIYNQDGYCKNLKANLLILNKTVLLKNQKLIA